MTTAYFDYTGLAQFAEQLRVAPEKVDAIAQQTINTALERGRTQVARRYRDQIKQPYADALARINVSKVSFSKGYSEGTISAARKGRRLSAFDHQGLGRAGVQVEVGRYNGPKTIEPAFLFTSRQGVPLIGFRRPGSRKYNALYGPSPSQVFDTDRPKIAADLELWMSVEMNRRILSVAGGKYNQAKSNG